MKNLQGKTAIVTGGASGIGNGIAKALGRAGCNIVIIDARQEAIDAALPFFANKGYPAVGIQLDVTDRDGWEKTADTIEARFGDIHILVNNAGVAAGSGKIWEGSYKDWDFISGINIDGVYNGIHTIVPRILKHGGEGHVVSTSSTGGAFAVSGSGFYCTTKFAVAGMMECLASDLEGTNIGASAFFPGPVNSNLGMSSAQVRPDKYKDNKAAVTPPPEAGSSDEAPPPFAFMDFTKIFMTPEEVGERVVRGIRRNDLFIWTHPEFKAGMAVRNKAIIEAFPDEPINENRANSLKMFGTLTYNPVYESQTTPAAPDWPDVEELL
ncbi:MAG: SDR family NAD(P)-dependent oxidoreductase [Oscillospiraceae bacterium]|jgi:NAD(P)-dependent dehydrogenase (short-subunit alcohol dehydrogenase family)|nr:SDR family NAD(P)-dependent oxidoreductase [Oscillospiraceae bacterium]